MTILHESAVSLLERAKTSRDTLLGFDIFGFAFAEAWDGFVQDGQVAPPNTRPVKTPKPEDVFLGEFYAEMFRTRPFDRQDQAGKGFRIEATLDWLLARYGASVGTSMFDNGLVFLSADCLISRVTAFWSSMGRPLSFSVSYFGLAATSRIAAELRDLPWERLVQHYDEEALAAQPIYKAAFRDRLAVMGTEYEAYRALFVRAAEAGDCIVLRDIG